MEMEINKQNFSKEIQLKLIKEEFQKEKMIIGQKYYIISSKWFEFWKDYVNYENKEKEKEIEDDKDDIFIESKEKKQEDDVSQKPGPIDNQNLIDSIKGDHIKLKNNLQEGDDYILIPESIWNLFYEWYGGGPTIVRYSIGEGLNQKPRVEVYPLYIKVNRFSENGKKDQTEIEEFVSKKSTIKQFKNEICNKISLNPNKVRMWSLFGTTPKLIENEDETFEDSAIVDGQRILFEVQLENGKWPQDSKLLKDKNNKFKNNHPQQNNNKDKKKTGLFSTISNFLFGSKNNNGTSEEFYTKGLCGLHNLGNTCFMNSGIQCLSNTVPLTEYFLRGDYEKDLNRKNPLGMKGRIAEEYGSLLKDMWSGYYECVTPNKFKSTLGKFAPQFSGYSQNDSQELLAFLLDGLHEDLNKITKKPYIPIKEDQDNRPEEEIAKESWEVHLKRNQSIIVDLFQGQLKSTLVCPKCNHISKTWDPFMYLSLPLPIEKERDINIIIVKYKDEWDTPIKYSIKISKYGKMEDLKKEVANILDMKSTHNIAIADIYNSKIYSFLSDNKPIWGIRANDITIAYELPENYTEDDCLRVQVIHRVFKKKSSNYFTNSSKIFGLPFLMFFDKNKCSTKQLYQKIFLRVKKFIKNLDNLKSKNDTDPYFPFKLRVVSSQGYSCGKCNANSCNGCEIEIGNNPVDLKESGHTISIDWNAKIFKENFNKEETESVYVDPSVKDNKNKKIKQITLHDCLKLFTTNEKLSENDPWYCPKCKEFQQAMKKIDLWKLPQILVIHLKRFLYTRICREKLDLFVEFPIEGLDLSSYVISKQDYPLIYDLFAVSNHSGGLSGGHYTAFAKNKIENKWFLFNDSSYSEVSESNIQSVSAYVLFYQRRDLSSINNNSVLPNNHNNMDVINNSTNNDITNDTIPTNIQITNTNNVIDSTTITNNDIISKNNIEDKNDIINDHNNNNITGDQNSSENITT